MQESEKKPRHAGKHAAPAPEPTVAQEDALLDAYDLMDDEDDIPLRSTKQKKSSAAAKGKPRGQKKSPSSGKKKKKRKGHSGARDALFSEQKFRRKRNLFEEMSATGEEGLFKPLHLFGREIRFWPLFLLVFLLMMVGVVIISNGNVEPVSETITVVGLPEELENYRILVLSDMNGKRFGDQQSALAREVENLGYDMILCVGDMVGKDGDPEPFYEFLDALSKPSRVYFVCGDSDPGPFVEVARDIQGTLEQIVLEDWILGAVERGATYVDAPMCVTVGDSKIWLTPTSYLNLDAIAYRDDWREQMKQEEDGTVSGLSSDYNTLPFTSYRYACAEKFYSAVNQISSSDLLIGLSHIVPDDGFIESASTHDEDGAYLFEPELIISGHYCGGVWKLPFLGAFYVPNRMLPRYGWFPATEDVDGLSRIGETQVYITAGLSTTSSIPVLPFRLLNSPEVVSLKLTAKLPESMLDAG